MAKRQSRESCSITAASPVHWEQYGPRDASSNETNKYGHLKKAQEEISVKRGMIEDVDVWESSKLFNPPEQTGCCSRSLLTGLPHQRPARSRNEAFCVLVT